MRGFIINMAAALINLVFLAFHLTDPALTITCIIISVSAAFAFLLMD